MNINILFVSVEPGRGGLARIINIQEQHFALIEKVDIIGTVYFSKHDKDREFYKTNTASYYLDEFGSVSSKFSLIRYIQRIIALRRLVKKKKINTIIAHGEGGCWVSAFVSCPNVIAVLHGSTVWWQPKSLMKSKGLKLWKKKCFSKFNQIVTVSSALRDEIKSEFGIENALVIKNCVETPKNVMSSPAATDTQKLGLKIFALGRLAKEKNLEAAIRILRLLKNRGIDCSLVLVGDGPFRNELIALASKLSLTWEIVESGQRNLSAYKADILITGFVTDPEFFIKQSDILVLTSFTEGYPLSVCEALVYGKPVFVADCPTGPREILFGEEGDYPLSLPALAVGKGYLLPIPDSDENDIIWTEKIIKYYLSPDARRDVYVNASNMAAEFGIDRYIKEWIRLLR